MTDQQKHVPIDFFSADTETLFEFTARSWKALKHIVAGASMDMDADADWESSVFASLRYRHEPVLIQVTRVPGKTESDFRITMTWNGERPDFGGFGNPIAHLELAQGIAQEISDGEITARSLELAGYVESGLSLDDELRHYEFFDLIYPILRSNAGMKKRDADFFSHQIARDILEKLEAEENGDRPN